MNVKTKDKQEQVTAKLYCKKSVLTNETSLVVSPSRELFFTTTLIQVQSAVRCQIGRRT